MSSYTSTQTYSETFTVVHARHIASKVAADLERFRRFYGSPSSWDINSYEKELIVLLKFDAIDKVTYGFRRNSLWTMASARYVALPGGTIHMDDDPGRIRPGLDVRNATFGSFLEYSSLWWNRPASERASTERELPFSRQTGSESGLEHGNWVSDRSYAAGGCGLGRSTVRI